MCGICGAVGFTDNAFVDVMSRRMRHRGPDDIGLWQEGLVCLGHTRLAIIDLSAAGHQPMSNEDSNLWVTFNGEIYNFHDLKKELTAKGHVFKSNTDTEVILHLYEEYGERCAEYLWGMFSFAIWDRRSKKMFAARDRLGIKPFFYFHEGGRFIFASEVRAMLASGRIEKSINTEAAAGYFKYGSVQAPAALINGIFQLLPGHYLVLKEKNLEIKRYWDIGDAPPAPDGKSEEDHISEISGILDEAVRIRMISDVPLGAFLSGGVDSSAIISLMQRHAARPVKTFSVIFKENTYDERRYSDLMAQKAGTDHTRILLTDADILKEMPDIFDAMDLPSADGFNTFVISRAVKKAGITVALSGLGGDELFAGYSSFKTLPRLAKLCRISGRIPCGIREGLFGLLNGFAVTRRGLKLFYCALKCKELDELYYLKRMIFLPHEIDRLIQGAQAQEERPVCLGHNSGLDDINRLSCLELKGYLRNTLLQDTDRMSMAHALEVRVPFLDHRLVEKMFQVPGAMKAAGGIHKRLLVRSLNGLLPDEVVKRPKMGFVFPFESWLKGALKGYCEDRFTRHNLAKVSFLNGDMIRRIWADYLKGSKMYNYSSILTILSFMNWFDKNITE